MNLISKTLHRFYRVMQRRYPTALWYGNESRREIALTFDDGPHLRDTPLVLDVLAKHNIQATFFLIGQTAESHPALIKQIHQSGHQLGIHCYRHVPYPLEDPSTLRAQLDHTRTIMSDACGISPQSIRDVRPPYGFFTARTLSLLSEWHYRLALWNSIPPHFLQPVSWTAHQVLDQIVPGSVIALHDGKGYGSKVVQIVDILIPRLKRLGFGFVTIEQMHNFIKGK